MLNWLRNQISFDNPLRRAWHFLRGFTAALVYGFPGRKLICIGITGTNGKTTTTHLIEHILRAAGKKVGMVSTVSFAMNGLITPNLTHKTTLSPFLTQKFLRECVRQGVEVAVIESSSQALHQFRLVGIPFRVAVLTNITHEHLNYHGTMEKYKESKKALFKNVQTAILNTADTYFEEFNHLPVPQKITYGFDRGDLQAQHPQYSKFGTRFTMSFPHNLSFPRRRESTDPRLLGDDNEVEVNLKLPGAFNVENVLAATGAALACGLTLSAIAPALQTFEGVAGRMERITSPKGFEVIVDFGLTPDALQKLYDTICATATGRVIGIIGSCGTRDKEKRPALGRIVAEHCDLTLVTDEESYTEDPRAIMQAVLDGALSTGKRKGIEVELIEDRYQAIEYAIAHARPGDTIVATGMGAFDTREMPTGPIPWDERQVVREIISKYT